MADVEVIEVSACDVHGLIFISLERVISSQGNKSKKVISLIDPRSRMQSSDQ